MKALIADDDVFVRKCITQMLPWQELDFSQILEAENGAAALKIALVEKPDLIITDVKMPILNGLELAERLRDMVLDNCIIILSEYSDFEFVQKAMTYGVQDYILKPITRERLSEITEKIRVLMGELIKKRYYNSLKTNREDISRLVQEMLDTGDWQSCADAFEFMAMNRIHIKDLKRFGMMFLDELYGQVSALGYRKAESAARQEEAMGTYSALKNVTDIISFVRAECGLAASFCAQRTPQSINYVDRIDAYIEKNYADPNLSVASVSDWLHLSPVYCGALYKQQRGKSIINSIHEVRMRHAQELLRNGDMNVAGVSRQVGYMTPDYFSRLFSASFGMSPSQYRALTACDGEEENAP